jgi:hypothetical protein
MQSDSSSSKDANLDHQDRGNTILDDSGDDLPPPSFDGAAMAEAGMANGGEMLSLMGSRPPTFEPAKKRCTCTYPHVGEAFLSPALFRVSQSCGILRRD